MSLPHTASCPTCNKQSVFPITLKHPTLNLTLRPIKRSDNQAIANHANNPVVYKFLNPFFPKPYTLKDADEFVAKTYQAYKSELSTNVSINQSNSLESGESVNQLTADELDHAVYHCAVSSLAVCVDDLYIGTINYFPFTLDSVGDNKPPTSEKAIDKLNYEPVKGEPMELGYWLGQAYHGQGIGKLMLPAFIEYAESTIKQNIKQSNHQSVKPFEGWLMNIHNDNVANQTLANRMGFNQSGYWIDPYNHDAIVRIYTKYEKSA